MQYGNDAPQTKKSATSELSTKRQDTTEILIEMQILTFCAGMNSASFRIQTNQQTFSM